MAAIIISAIGLLIATTLVHYELLRWLSYTLPCLRMRSRAKLLVVIFATFSGHALQIVMYGIALYALSRLPGTGGIGGFPPTWSTCVYLSSETFTSLGFGDVIAHGPLRFMAGAECLNGLLLIGWSGSYIYISMERFWQR